MVRPRKHDIDGFTKVMTQNGKRRTAINFQLAMGAVRALGDDPVFRELARQGTERQFKRDNMTVPPPVGFPFLYKEFWTEMGRWLEIAEPGVVASSWQEMAQALIARKVTVSVAVRQARQERLAVVSILRSGDHPTGS